MAQKKDAEERPTDLVTVAHPQRGNKPHVVSRRAHARVWEPRGYKIVTDATPAGTAEGTASDDADTGAEGKSGTESKGGNK